MTSVTFNHPAHSNGWDGNTVETAVTNAAANDKGWPARLSTGELIFVTSPDETHPPIYVDADGNTYLADPHGLLVRANQKGA